MEGSINPVGVGFISVVEVIDRKNAQPTTGRRTINIRNIFDYFDTEDTHFDPTENTEIELSVIRFDSESGEVVKVHGSIDLLNKAIMAAGGNIVQVDADAQHLIPA